MLTHRTTALLLFCFVVFSISGCSNDNVSDPHVALPDSEELLIPLDATRLEKQSLELTISELRAQFPGDLINNDWEPLKKVLNSETFLKYVSPAGKAFKSFEAFLASTLPPKERYEPFLKEEINIAGPIDFRIVHKLTLATLSDKAKTYHGIQQPDEEKALVKVLASQEVIDWGSLRFSTENGKIDGQKWVNFIIQHSFFAKEIEKENQTTLNGLIEEHNRDRALIHFSITHPTMMWHLVNDFTDVNVFKKWLKGEFF